MAEEHRGRGSRLCLQKHKRPRIFGMTASPLDTKAKASAGHMEIFFAGLEASLDAKVLRFSLQQMQKNGRMGTPACVTPEILTLNIGLF